MREQRQAVFGLTWRGVLGSILGLVIAFATTVPVAAAPPVAPANASGRWIDVDLSTLQLTAYRGSTPVRVIAVSSGKPGWETPTGEFTIQRRVYNETMNSATIGRPGRWYLENVLFTQYFTGYGHALHYNWWSPRSVFGNQRVSAGCVSMDYADAAFLWNFASVGTPVSIHY